MAIVWDEDARARLHESISSLSDEQTAGIHYILSHLVRFQSPYQTPVHTYPLSVMNTSPPMLPVAAGVHAVPSHPLPTLYSASSSSSSRHSSIMSDSSRQHQTTQWPNNGSGARVTSAPLWSEGSLQADQPRAMTPMLQLADPTREVTVDLMTLAPAVCEVLDAYSCNVAHSPLTTARELVNEYFRDVKKLQDRVMSMPYSVTAVMVRHHRASLGQHYAPPGVHRGSSLGQVGLTSPHNNTVGLTSPQHNTLLTTQAAFSRSSSSGSHQEGSNIPLQRTHWSLSSPHCSAVPQAHIPSELVAPGSLYLPHASSSVWERNAELAAQNAMYLPHTSSGAWERTNEVAAKGLSRGDSPRQADARFHYSSGVPVFAGSDDTGGKNNGQIARPPHHYHLTAPPPVVHRESSEWREPYAAPEHHPNLISNSSDRSDFNVIRTPSPQVEGAATTVFHLPGAKPVGRLISSISGEHADTALAEPATPAVYQTAAHVGLTTRSAHSDGMALMADVAVQELYKSSSEDQRSRNGVDDDKPTIDVGPLHLPVMLPSTGEGIWTCRNCFHYNMPVDSKCVVCDADPAFAALVPATHPSIAYAAPSSMMSMGPNSFIGGNFFRMASPSAPSPPEDVTSTAAGTKRKRSSTAAHEDVGPQRGAGRRRASHKEKVSEDEEANTPASRKDGTMPVKSYARHTSKSGQPACPECGKTFRSHSDVEAHIRTHTGEKPLQCSYPGCTKRFAHVSNLKVHERGHTGVKPYACPYPGCSKAYRHPSSRDDHVDAAHKGLRKYKCVEPGCNRAFTAVANLNRHKRTAHGIATGKSTEAADSDADGSGSSDA